MDAVIIIFKVYSIITNNKKRQPNRKATEMAVFCLFLTEKVLFEMKINRTVIIKTTVLIWLRWAIATKPGESLNFAHRIVMDEFTNVDYAQVMTMLSTHLTSFRNLIKLIEKIIGLCYNNSKYTKGECEFNFTIRNNKSNKAKSLLNSGCVC